jgi:hypothetical protein
MDFSDLRDDAGPQPWPDRPEGVILEGVVGSRAYGLAWEGSDEDRLGVFLAPSDEFFGLDDVAETVKNPWSDEVLHELGKFCRLALKVNPTVTELLWLEEYPVLTMLGQELIELRSAFLSASYCRNAYLGYATSQFAKLKDRGDGSFSSDLRSRTAKHARHLARLLTCGFGLWSTGRLQVRLDAPQWYHDFGDKVADGDLQAAEDLLAKYEQMFDETSTILPAEPERERVDAWLRSARIRALRSRPATLQDAVKVK